MRYAILITIVLLGSLSTSPATAADWLIKSDGTGDAPTIQAGIDAASSVPGQDRVILANGTFTGAGNRNITLNKPITLTSQNGADNAIVDMGGQRGIIVVAMSGEPTISNITIRNASYTAGNGGGIVITGEDAIVTGCVISGCTAEYGGGIYIDGASPTIQNNEITGNNTTSGQGGGICIMNGSTALIDGNVIASNWNDTGFGAGMYAGGSAPTITNNEIYDNDAGVNKGGGIYMGYANGVYTISNNVIYNNRTKYGGGMLIKASSGGIISHNTIVDNWCKALGGGLILEGSVVTVEHTIIAFNTGGQGIYCFDSQATLSCSVVWNPDAPQPFSCQTQNIINADPEFCGSTASRNFELQSDSPASAANNACGEDIGAMGVSCGIVPTLLQGFSARVQSSRATISWQLAEAGDNMRYFVFRENLSDGTFTQLDASAIARDDLSFTLVDPALVSGSYRYRVEVEDEEERRVLFVTQNLDVSRALTRLHANQPNPFNPTTRIRYDVGIAGRIRLEVFDVTGRLVKVLFDGRRDAGEYEAAWNATNQAGVGVSSGVYFYRLRTADTTDMRKMILIR